ncbi:cytochrome P450 71A1-like [Dioscorea cayenensis subsp. rotundata]|uniref:Cytochrome P450 71A1-like n=1 Tax=Dioscorea cayennensis subsp. rotundata TaxID=55577 RepID=A0AB40BBN6_DIOCR|nr:cytochrome P450 71A1-like [Dioscorea cayenensis subsp. rotundata]
MIPQSLSSPQQWLHEQHQYPYWFIPIAIVTSCFFLFLFYKSSLSSKKKLNHPPCPLILPLVGNLHQLGSLPHRSLHALSQKHGPLMLLHLGKVPAIIISSAELAQEIMKTHDLIFSSRPFSSMANSLLYNSLDISFAPYGEYWRQVRRISVIHLLSLKRVESFKSIREEEVSLMLDKIHASQGLLVNFSEILVAVTNGVVCRVALGRKYDRSNRFHDMLTEFLALLGSFPLKDFIPWFGWVDRITGLDARVVNNSKEMDGFFEEVLEEHIHSKTSETSNLVDILLSLDVSLSKESIKAIILDMFSAGTDTTFTVLEWTMAELMRNPEVIEKVQEEIEGVVKGKAKVSEEDIDEMSYLKAVIKEVLRLHPPIPLLVPRESTEYVKLHGFDIPEKTRVVINAWAIGRDPKSWERPEEFMPERFLNSEVDFKGQHFEFIPFGAGRRGCPGIMFAISTIELAAAALLHHFDWKLPDGMRTEELDMSESSGLTVHKKTSLLVQATPRF